MSAIVSKPAAATEERDIWHSFFMRAFWLMASSLFLESTMCIRSASWTDLARDCVMVVRLEEATLCSRAGSAVCWVGGGGGRARWMELVGGNGGPIGIWNGGRLGSNEKADGSRLM